MLTDEDGSEYDVINLAASTARAEIWSSETSLIPCSLDRSSSCPGACRQLVHAVADAEDHVNDHPEHDH